MNLHTSVRLTAVAFMLMTGHALADETAARQIKASAETARNFERFADAAHFFTLAARAAHEAGAQALELECLTELATMAGRTGRLADVDACLRRLLATQMARGSPPRDVHTTRLLLAHGLLTQGNVTEAATFLSEPPPVPSLMAHYDIAVGLLCRLRNDTVATERHLRRGATRFVREGVPVPPGCPNPLITLGSFYLDTGRPERAKRAFLRAAAKLPPFSAGMLTLRLELARLYLSAGSQTEAELCMNDATAIARHVGSEYALQKVVDFMCAHGFDSRAQSLLDAIAKGYAATADLVGLRRCALVYRNCNRSSDAARLFGWIWARLDTGGPVTSYLGILVAEEYSIVLWHLGREEEAKELTKKVPALQYQTPKNGP